jgi:signal transduction histidine kinase
LAVTGLESDERIPEDVRSDLRMIHRNVEMEARLIDDLLDLSRIMQGKMPLQVELMDVHAKIRNSIDICRSDINEKRLRLNLELRAKRHRVRADAARIQQVLWNLIKNAAKFSPEGGSITVATDDVEGDWLRIQVIDEGIGIEADVLPRLFDAFEQGGHRLYWK